MCVCNVCVFACACVFSCVCACVCARVYVCVSPRKTSQELSAKKRFSVCVRACVHVCVCVCCVSSKKNSQEVRSKKRSNAQWLGGSNVTNCQWVMSHMDESCHINESRHIWMSHVTCDSFMCLARNNVTNCQWGITSRTANETYHVWTSQKRMEIPRFPETNGNPEISETNGNPKI